MKTIYKVNLWCISLFIIMTLTSCGTDWLDEQPLSSISTATFWKTAEDVELALVGVYNYSSVSNFLMSNHHLITASATDDSEYKNCALNLIYSGYFQPGETQVVQDVWNQSYYTIFRVNYFLENIESVEMNSELKAQYIAEMRFIRAFEYYFMSVFYGGVPLVTKVLTIPEANSFSRNSLEEIVNYAISELTEAAKNLPATRPANERGRILKAAALAVKGRLLMTHKRWGEAVNTYKEIIDLGAHQIDPRYKAIFEEIGETSDEIILSAIYVEGLRGNRYPQLNYLPDFYGGYQENNVTQDLVDAFLVTDGLSIEESPLYDPANPFKNRDPRMYASLFLPEYTEWQGTLYLGHPELTSSGIATMVGGTGYGWKKFSAENYTGNVRTSGADVTILRYAEVLLGYLESKIENGETITQELLDQTINRVRGRDEVKMPAVTETDPSKLRDILRRERRVEFCLEKLIRYTDIRRWGLFPDILNRKVYGMKLTDDPDNYTKYRVETTGKYRGHYIALDKTGTYKSDMAIIPIPQYEININPNLKQNPGY